jgi:DNA-binding CsgD family transcriptional regulator/PAS domain-containing protein
VATRELNEIEQFSELVESIYDAALDATLWSDALEGVCGFAQGCAANLFYQGAAPNDMIHFYAWGDDPDYRQLSLKSMRRLNPLFPAALFLEVGKVHAVPDVMPIDEFRATRMYREWARPQGLLDALHANLERSAAGTSSMSFAAWSATDCSTTAREARFMLLVPHLRRAVAIGGVLDFQKARESALSATLDRLTAAVLLVTAEGRLVYVNAKADAMLVAGEVLRAPNGRVTAVAPDAERKLRDAIAAAARGDADLGVKGIAITLAERDDTSQVARVLPLTSGERRGMLDRKAAAAIFVHQTQKGVPAPLETMTKLYGLTAGEVRVLAAVAETSGVASMAAALGISQATIKTHLQSLFAKTGVRRQADLVKLLTRHAPSLQL